jgi:P27 family predicted phage terminase small subunit
MAENIPKRKRYPDPGRAAPQAVPDPPDPPDHLGPESRRHWEDAVGGWILGTDALPLLQAACECWDRYADAREEIREDGPTVVHPTSGAINAHPAHAVMRDNLREWRQLWRQLALAPPEAP